MFGERGNHAFPGVTVPSFRTGWRNGPQHTSELFHDVGGIWHEAICPLADGDRAFGIRPNRETGDAERSGFFLKTARICYNSEGVLDEIEHLQVSHLSLIHIS